MRVVAQGGDPASVRAGSLLARRPVVIREDAGVLDATKLPSRREVRRLPVVSRTGKLVGIISLDDLLTLIGSELSHIASTLASELGRSRVLTASAPTGLDRGLAHPKNGLEMPDKRPRSREASEMAGPRRRAARREALAGELEPPAEARHARGATVDSVLETAPLGILTIDRTGRIVSANGELERMFGYERGELAGHSVDTLLPKRLRAAHARQRGGFFADPRVRRMGLGVDLVARRKDGREFPVEISLSFVEKEDEAPRARLYHGHHAAQGRRAAPSGGVRHDARVCGYRTDRSDRPALAPGPGREPRVGARRALAR